MSRYSLECLLQNEVLYHLLQCIGWVGELPEKGNTAMRAQEPDLPRSVRSGDRDWVL
jgi:hypothetical protein